MVTLKSLFHPPPQKKNTLNNFTCWGLRQSRVLSTPEFLSCNGWYRESAFSQNMIAKEFSRLTQGAKYLPIGALFFSQLRISQTTINRDPRWSRDTWTRYNETYELMSWIFGSHEMLGSRLGLQDATDSAMGKVSQCIYVSKFGHFYIISSNYLMRFHADIRFFWLAQFNLPMWSNSVEFVIDDYHE